MELRVLHYFLTVAKEQSFTKAAEQLHITQPTLSRQLAALEDELQLNCSWGNEMFLQNRNIGLMIQKQIVSWIDDCIKKEAGRFIRKMM